MITLGIIFLSVLFVLSCFFTLYLTNYLAENKVFDHPNQRSLHEKPTPRGGGLAFVILFYIAVWLLFFCGYLQGTIVMALMGGIPVALVGYCDDAFGVASGIRFLVHILSAAFGLLWLHTAPFFFVSVFVTVWFINLYNFMDGIDGLAGMEGIFVSIVAAIVLFFHGFGAMALVCFALAACIGGFLISNWSPAKIFMGDVGSGFLGYVLAMLMWITNRYHEMPILFWWILLGVFLTDATFTLLHRMIQKKKWYLAHREHAYQRLAQNGYSHEKITLMVLCVNVLFCLPVALIYGNLHKTAWIVIFGISVVIIFALSWFYIIKKYSVKG